MVTALLIFAKVEPLELITMICKSALAIALFLSPSSSRARLNPAPVPCVVPVTCPPSRPPAIRRRRRPRRELHAIRSTTHARIREGYREPAPRADTRRCGRAHVREETTTSAASIAARRRVRLITHSRVKSAQCCGNKVRPRRCFGRAIAVILGRRRASATVFGQSTPVNR